MGAAEALELLGRGWSVFPLKDKRTPYSSWKERQKQLPGAEEVAAWWVAHPDAWTAVALGEASDLVRVDADGERALQELESLGGPGVTLAFTTPGGGRGYLYKYEPGLQTAVLWSGRGEHEELRVQSTGAYTVLPPSPGYRWVDAGVPVAKVPRWLYNVAVDQILAAEARRLSPPALTDKPEDSVLMDALQHIDPDEYTQWVNVGIALKASGGGTDRFLAAWTEWSRSSDKFQEGECERKWTTFPAHGKADARNILLWARKNGWRHSGCYERLTDAGFARVLAREGAGAIKHCEKWGWLHWDGMRWARDGSFAAVQELQKALVSRRYGEAVESRNRVLRCVPIDAAKLAAKTDALKAIKRFEFNERLVGVRSAARSDARLACSTDDFDKHPWLLNCPNGTLDLRTMEVREHDPADMLTQMCPTEYCPEARCPRWEQFMQEVFGGDVSIVEYVRRLLGYCLTGVIADHILPVLWGSGRNGKSTLVRTFHTVLGGDYAAVAPSGFLLQSKSPKHYETVGLYGKRFVADVETSESVHLHEEMVKKLTGGDPLKARDLYESFWEFLPTHKLFLATNHEPLIRGTETAIWSRVKKVPFEVSFLGREERGLDERLLSEAAGILAWASEGCRRWRAEGTLAEPAAVTNATREYRQSENTVARFVEEMLAKGSPEDHILKRVVAPMYRAWCVGTGTPQLSSKAFGQVMTELGYTTKGSNVNYYHGLKQQ